LFDLLDNFLGVDKTVAVAVEGAELGELLAALLPLLERHLAVLVRVELLEPRRQALDDSPGEVRRTHRQREGAGAHAAHAGGDDAVDAALGGAVGDACAAAAAVAVVAVEDLAVDSLQ